MDTSSLAQATVLGGLATTLATEILKSQYIPVPATKYPRTVAAVVSLLAAGYVVYQYNVHNIAGMTWPNWLALAGLMFLVSVTTYNHVLKGL